MKIYTSSYWNYTGKRGVQISNGRPDIARVYRALPLLYPDWSMVNKWNRVKKLPKEDVERQMVWKEFETEYWQKLNRIGIETIESRLCDGDVLLCWCSKECHRHILAEFLRRNGIEATEWNSVYNSEE